LENEFVIKKYVQLLFLIYLQFWVSQAPASGTVVGNGGDPIFEFMEAARSSMVQTIKAIATDPAETKSFCAEASASSEQIQFCRQFFLAVSLDILKLSQGEQRTAFVLREDPLLVQGPDGKPMVVAARTDLGPLGVIELHRDSVKTLLPTQVLFLIMHEFQHKVIFQDHSVTDNEKIGPFVNGRELLDTVSTALVTVAKKKGLIGSQFGIRDIFDCQAITDVSQFGAKLASSRLFLSEDLMSYETSIGKNPMDGSIYIPESRESTVLLRFVITEPNNCGMASSARKNRVQIIRSVQKLNEATVETVLESKDLTENPMCPGANSQFEIANGPLRFSCTYFGSAGTTSLRRLRGRR
jgi:hypothetical protein